MCKHEIIEVFSQTWWITIILSSCVIACTISLSKLPDKERQKSIARYLGIGLLFIAIYIHIYQIIKGEWDVRFSLPLNLCCISGIISGLVLIYPNQTAYEFLLFWGIPGAFHSFITPELTLGNRGWYFYDYYLMHGGIILSVLFLTFIFNFKPRAYSWLKVWLWSQVLILFVFLVDVFVDANYMYLIDKPIAKNPLVIGDWPWYILGFEIAALIHVYLVYQLFKKRSPLK